MGIIGAIIGGIVGGATFGPIGAIAGAALGAGIGQNKSDTRYYGYCPGCNEKVSFPSDHGVFKCNYCDTPIVVVKCPHCFANLVGSDIGATKCPECGSTFTIGLCKDCGELYTFETKRHIRKKCEKCGGEIISKGAQEEDVEMLSIVVGVISLGMEIAAADGHIDDVEIRQIKDFFINTGIDANGMAVIDEIINRCYYEKPPVNDIIKELNSIMKKEDKLMLIEFLFRIAAADGIVENSEIDRIKQFSEKLKINDADFETISNRYNAFKKETKINSDIAYYCKILNVSIDSDFEEIKKSYRELCKKYHPDKFASMGDEFVEIATIKFQEIQTAYDELKKYHNTM